MQKLLSSFFKTKKDIFKKFGCEVEYFLKFEENAIWKLSTEDSVTFLSYGEAGKIRSNCVVVNKSGKPMVFSCGDYTMIVAIECIKTAIIFKTKNKAI